VDLPSIQYNRLAEEIEFSGGIYGIPRKLEGGLSGGIEN
jgi:hypothetical protein